MKIILIILLFCSIASAQINGGYNGLFTNYFTNQIGLGGVLDSSTGISGDNRNHTFDLFGFDNFNVDANDLYLGGVNSITLDSSEIRLDNVPTATAPLFILAVEKGTASSYKLVKIPLCK